VDNGIAVAEHDFEIRIGELKVLEDLQRLEEMSVSDQAEETFHIEFGKELYKKVFAGKLGEYFKKSFEAAQNQSMRLRIYLRFDENAVEIAALPWEFLHDGKDFLVTNRTTLISRLPPGVSRGKFDHLKSMLRMLVVISMPDDPEISPLNTELEQEVIIEAVDKLNREHKMKVDFTDDASFETIESYLNEKEYHIVHFASHGKYDEIKDRGYLILEDEEGNAKEVDNGKITDLLAGKGIRTVVLSACQSGKVSNKQAYADLASILAKKNIPAVVAMQYSIIDLSATKLASTFYQAIANGKAVDIALTDARISMKNSDKSNGVDFATPVLYLSDPECIMVGEIKPTLSEDSSKKLEILGDLQILRKGFIGRRKELRVMQKALLEDKKRAVIIYGIGGMGKTVLATRFASKMDQYFKGVLRIKCNSATRPMDILDKFNSFLNFEGSNNLNKIIYENVSLETKTTAMVNILNKWKFLIIFDNFEDCLDDTRTHIANPELKEFIQQLLNNTTNTKFIFTTRINFNPIDGTPVGCIEHISLPELSYPQMVWLMNTYKELADLEPGKKLKIFRAIGGHPWALSQFTHHVSKETVDGLLSELARMKHDVINFTLLDKSYSKLDTKSKALLLRATIYQDAVPLEALLWIMGIENQPSPSVIDGLSKLVNWGLITKQEEKGTTLYSMHAIVKEFAEQEFKKGNLDKNVLMRRAASYYENSANSFDDHIRKMLQEKGEATQIEIKMYTDLFKAREYYYKAGALEKADDITEKICVKLVQWGEVESAKRILKQSIETTKGDIERQTRAKYWFATILHRMGDLDNALKLFTEVYNISRDGGTLYRIGLVNQDQGNYGEAGNMFKQALRLYSDLWILIQLGMVYQDRGNYEEAVELYKKCQENMPPDAKHNISATILHQFGMLNQDQGNYDEAIKLFQESLQMCEEIETRIGIASCRHQLGIIYRKQGNFEKAIEMLQQSLKIAKEVMNKSSMAKNLHQLGNIHNDQGNYDNAIQHYKQSLSINEELGNRRGIASFYYQIGNICQKKGNYEKALEHYQKSLQIDTEIENRRGMASNLYEIGMINYRQKNYNEAINLINSSLNIKIQLGNKNSEIAVMHQLGNIFKEIGDIRRFADVQSRIAILYSGLGKYDDAVKLCNESLRLGKELDDQNIQALCLSNLGNVRHRQGKYGDAIKLYRQSLKTGEDLVDKGDKAVTLFNIGCSYFLLDKYKMSSRFIEHSLNIEGGLGNRTNIDALRFLISIYEKLGDKSNLAKNLGKLGNLRFQEGQRKDASKDYGDALSYFDVAIKLHQESLKMFKELGDNSSIEITKKQLEFICDQEFRTRCAEALSNPSATRVTLQKRIPYEGAAGDGIKITYSIGPERSWKG
jgi:tetratricopeptide (TPR) repeat protein/TusA-related sulfurtransferase